MLKGEVENTETSKCHIQVFIGMDAGVYVTFCQNSVKACSVNVYLE